MNAPRIAVALALLLGIGISACSDDNPSDPGNGSGTGAPNPGTSYTHRGVSSDEFGRIIQQRDVISIIAETNQSHFGRTGLVKMVSAGAPGFLDYRSNGDLGLIFYVSNNGVLVDSSWVDYPFGSKGSGTFRPVDQNLMGTRVTMNGEFSYVGTETVTVPAGTFETQKVRVTQRMAMGDPGDPSVALLRNERVDTLYYAPSIRYLAKQSGVQHHVFSGDTTTYYNVVTLSAYSLK